MIVFNGALQFYINMMHIQYQGETLPPVVLGKFHIWICAEVIKFPTLMHPNIYDGLSAWMLLGGDIANLAQTPPERLTPPRSNFPIPFPSLPSPPLPIPSLPFPPPSP